MHIMFSITESIKFGWEKFKNNLNISLGTTLLVLAVGALGELGGKRWHGFGMLIVTIALVVVSIILRIGYTKIFLRIVDGEQPKFTDIFNAQGIFWRYLGTSILYGLIVIGGLILLIVPGIYWAVKYSFSQITTVDNKAMPKIAIKESGSITKGSWWKLFGFFIIVGLLNMLGALIFGVGLLVSVPVTMFAVIYVYRELSRAKAGITPAPLAGLTSDSMRV